MSIKRSTKDKRPVYLKVSEILREELKNLPADTAFPKEEELALRFGINRHTLRKAVKPLKEEGLIYSIRSKGLFLSARQEHKKRSMRICYVMNDELLNNSYFERIQGMSQVLENAGYKLIVAFNSPKYQTVGMSYKQLLENGKVDGFIIGNAGDNSCISEIERKGFPMLQSSYRSKVSKCFVHPNFHKAVRDAAGILFANGHRNIRMLRLEEPEYNLKYDFRLPEHTDTSEMARALVMAGKELGVNAPSEILTYRHDSSLPALMNRLLDKEKVTGLIIMDNVEGTWDLINAAGKAGFKVPEHFSAVGLVNSKNVSGLSAFMPDVEENGRVSAQLMIDLIEGRVNSVREILLDLKFIPGHTVAMRGAKAVGKFESSGVISRQSSVVGRW